MSELQFAVEFDSCFDDADRSCKLNCVAAKCEPCATLDKILIILGPFFTIENSVSISANA